MSFSRNNEFLWSFRITHHPCTIGTSLHPWISGYSEIPCNWFCMGNRWRQGHGSLTPHSKLPNSYLLFQKVPGAGETAVKVLYASPKGESTDSKDFKTSLGGAGLERHRSYRTTPIGPCYSQRVYWSEWGHSRLGSSIRESLA